MGGHRYSIGDSISSYTILSLEGFATIRHTCGAVRTVERSVLRKLKANGGTKCVECSGTHRRSLTPEYAKWENAKQRSPRPVTEWLSSFEKWRERESIFDAD